MTKNEDNVKKERHSSKKLIYELNKKLETEKQKSEDYLNRLKYLQADFDNFEKRIKREREDIIKVSNEKIINKLLLINDQLELAVVEVKKIMNSESVVKGLELILINLFDILKQEGVEKIISVGKKLDPLKHDAASFIETEDVEEGTVIRELRKGYFLNNKVIRPAMVEVARKPVKVTEKKA